MRPRVRAPSANVMHREPVAHRAPGMGRPASFAIGNDSSDICCCYATCRCMRDAGANVCEVRPPNLFCRVFNVAAFFNVQCN